MLKKILKKIMGLPDNNKDLLSSKVPGKHDFSVGSLISNGEKRRVVLTKPIMRNGEWIMLISDYQWDCFDDITKYGEEVKCIDWYLISK